MLAAFEQSGKHRPVILAYAREDESGFRQRLADASGGHEQEEIISQRKLVDSFIREQFYDAEGRNLRAVQSYREPISFAQRLHTHLRQVLDDLQSVDATPRWQEEPYRGLKSFEIEHSAIFHGRDEEMGELLQRLRDQHDAGALLS
ncbi:MAG: hypothetical protein SFV23_02300 [Planctomycetaceae bacterium]|nr:hypothetical protein [Planctomycetaceae bacterium]